MSKYIEKDWGTYKIIDSGDGFSVKELIIFPKCTLSYQQHEHRSEYWTVVEGKMDMLLEGYDFSVGRDSTIETVYIPKKSLHAAYNRNSNQVKIIEIWMGNLLSEDDITRESYPKDSWLHKNNWHYGRNSQWSA